LWIITELSYLTGFGIAATLDITGTTGYEFSGFGIKLDNSNSNLEWLKFRNLFACVQST